MSLKQQLSERLDDIRSRRPFVDHVVRTVRHYGAVKGNVQAGAVTYFAFLSFFPVLALAFAAIGWVSKVYPDARQNLVDAIERVLPGLVGPAPGQVQLSTIEDAAGAAAGIGLVVLVYSGLGWLSGMREALVAVFDEPPGEQPGFLVGKVRDLVTMVLIGMVLVASVAISGLVTSFSTDVLDWLGLATGLGWLLSGLSILVGLLANMVLFFAMFRLLADAELPRRSLWSGALFGAIGFEVLKQASRFLLQATAQSPAFQAFGIALILLVWINYFSRLVVYAAAWSYTSPAARVVRDRAEAEHTARIAATRVDLHKTPQPVAETSKSAVVKAFVTGGLTALGLYALLHRRNKP